MARVKKKPIPASIIRIPSFIFYDDVDLKQEAKHIYAIRKSKNTVLICNSNFTSPVYLKFSEVERIYNLIKGVTYGS